MLSNSSRMDACLGRGGWFALAAASLLLAAGGAAQADMRDVPMVAWGKANISYDQYRDEALECGKVGLAADIDHSDPVNTLRTAATQLSEVDQRWSMAHGSNAITWPNSGNQIQADAMARAQEEQSIEMGAQPKTQYARIKDLMFVEVRKCMTARGFSRFALTEAQRAEMSALKGKDLRRQYLYKLASNPEVLDKQKFVPKP